MLKHGETNPLNVHGLRQLDYCPPHFEQVTFMSYVPPKDLTDWLYENLEGRFHIGYVDVARSLDSKIIDRHSLVAFEIPCEASYFTLFLPQINNQADLF